MNDKVLERFWARVQKQDDGCWLWVGWKNEGGYGQFRSPLGRHTLVHRFSYLVHVGPIPDGLVIDHLCRVRNCVNPGHLEPVTIRENILRGQTVPAFNKAKTHCKQGHELAGDNLHVTAQGYRICRTCGRRFSRERYHRLRLAEVLGVAT